MNFNSSYQLKNKESRWQDVVFYFACALLIGSVCCYGIFMAKTYLQHQKINELDQKMLVYGSPQEKLSEKEVLDYKKKLGDYIVIINNHKISSNLFGFIEKNTLPDIWFSSINASEVENKVSLVGQAQTMEVLSNQIRIFEQSRDYIKNINVLNSKSIEQGKVEFTLDVSLSPSIFNY